MKATSDSVEQGWISLVKNTHGGEIPEDAPNLFWVTINAREISQDDDLNGIIPLFNRRLRNCCDRFGPKGDRRLKGWVAGVWEIAALRRRNRLVTAPFDRQALAQEPEWSNLPLEMVYPARPLYVFSLHWHGLVFLEDGNIGKFLGRLKGVFRDKRDVHASPLWDEARLQAELGVSYEKALGPVRTNLKRLASYVTKEANRDVRLVHSVWQRWKFPRRVVQWGVRRFLRPIGKFILPVIERWTGIPQVVSECVAGEMPSLAGSTQPVIPQGVCPVPHGCRTVPDCGNRAVLVGNRSILELLVRSGKIREMAESIERRLQGVSTKLTRAIIPDDRAIRPFSELAGAADDG